MPRRLVTPLACSASMVGRKLAACLSARAMMTLRAASPGLGCGMAGSVARRARRRLAASASNSAGRTCPASAPTGSRVNEKSALPNSPWRSSRPRRPDLDPATNAKGSKLSDTLSSHHRTAQFARPLTIARPFASIGTYPEIVQDRFVRRHAVPVVLDNDLIASILNYTCDSRRQMHIQGDANGDDSSVCVVTIGD
jgi:hypothetical protein